jgi:2-polyprenyl-6-methoxyphenol hydroxylase-like FAD-dependent oxidoreductase
MRSSGSPVDVRGAAWPIVARMGIVPQLRAAATQVRDLVFVDATGQPAGRMPVQPVGPDAEAVELPRGDLAAILQSAVRDSAELIYGDAITSLTQDAEGVDVAFERGKKRRFDLVIGADGTHSGVRRIVFGPEQEHVHHAGLYVATVPLRAASPHANEVLMYNEPGRALALHPARGRALAAFIFRQPEQGGLERGNLQQQRDCLAQAYAGAGYCVPAILAEALASEDLYFDSVCRVEVTSWSRGRIALLGDAASSVSLFGDGSSSAIVGAWTLAEALEAHPNNHEQALRTYEKTHRRYITPKHRYMWLGASLLVPRTQTGIKIRNTIARVALKARRQN